MRFVTIVVFIILAYLFFRYLMKALKPKTSQGSEGGGGPYGFHESACTEEEHRKVLGLTAEDSPATIRRKYRELLTKYHPDKVHHLGIEFQELAERRTKAITEAYRFFRNKYRF
jgi:DnaJ-domain-containing protein 1